MEANTIILPKVIGNWTRSDSQQAITSDTIFSYMNGAGELYLSYRFNHLDVSEYTYENHDDIQVELYYMVSSDDAYGLLSLDLEGEHISFDDAAPDASGKTIPMSPVARYGAGLLRLWSDNLYARIIVYRETPEAKQAIIDLGKAIVDGRKRSLPPDLLKRVPQKIGDTWELRPNRLSYFRSHMVLNSIYYISHENILNLDISAEAVAAAYKDISGSSEVKPCQFILINYENPERAVKALKRFYDAYLNEFTKNISVDNPNEKPDFFKLEEGWFGYKLTGKYLAIVSGCPNRESARIIIEKNWTQ